MLGSSAGSTVAGVLRSACHARGLRLLAVALVLGLGMVADLAGTSAATHAVGLVLIVGALLVCAVIGPGLVVGAQDGEADDLHDAG
ncbi:MAG: hypothetical protein JWN65_1839 [Solirubrobacterales bacterium]|nr:hypothetical protein [Solirubrobacterales bacterium]